MTSGILSLVIHTESNQKPNLHKYGERDLKKG